MSLQKLQYAKNSLDQVIKELAAYPNIQSQLIGVEKQVRSEMIKELTNEPSKDNFVQMRRELAFLAKKQRELKNKMNTVESGSSLQMSYQRELAQNKLEIQNIEKSRVVMANKKKQEEQGRA